MYIYTISTNLLSTWTKFVISESYKSYDLLSEMKEINRLVTGDWGVSQKQQQGQKLPCHWFRCPLSAG